MRIITHTCSNTEIVAALGAGDAIVGVDDHSDYPPDVVRTKARIGADLDIDIDRIVALKPDLVITSLTVPGHERCLEKIQRARLPHLITQPTCLADVADDIRRIGQAIQRSTQAKALADALEARCLTAPPAHDPVPVVVEWWPKPVIVPGQKSWVNEMLRHVGAYNPFETAPTESLEITGAQAVEAGVAAVVMSWCGVEEDKYRPHIVQRRGDWAGTPALINDHIYPISEAWLGRPGPRLVEGMDRLAHVVQAVRQRRQ